MVSRESGITDRTLARALTPKLLSLVRVLAVHGHLSAEDILGAIDVERSSSARENSDRHETRALESELAMERRTREFLETEVTDLQLGLTRALAGWRETKRKLTAATHQAAELRGQAELLVVATREGVESLQRLRNELGSKRSQDRALAEHARKMRAIVEIVGTLREPKQDAVQERAEAHGTR